MKQQITVEQLKELSEEKQKELRYWLIPRHCQPTSVDQEGCLFPPLHDVHYLPTIGLMIEFLDEHESFKTQSLRDAIITNKPHDDGWIELLHVEEWCDALWEACKDKIKNWSLTSSQ